MLAPFVFAMPVFLAALSTEMKFTESNTTVLGGRPLVSTRTRYVSGRRVRFEYRNVTGTMEGSVQYGPLIASVMQCDSGKAYEINFENREYAVGDLPRYPTLEEAKAKAAEPQAKLAAPETPIVVVERTTVRTGETLQMFGHTARHVITTKRYIPDKGAQHLASEQVRRPRGSSRWHKSELHRQRRSSIDSCNGGSRCGGGCADWAIWRLGLTALAQIVPASPSGLGLVDRSTQASSS